MRLARSVAAPASLKSLCERDFVAVSHVASSPSFVTVHPSLFDRASRALTMTCNGEIDRWVFGKLPNNAQVSGGGSVATNAFGLALRWKCDPIIFVGLDLSFPGGNYYVAGSADGNAKLESDRRQAPAASGYAQSAPLGTGHGRREESAAQWVAFERASDTPAETITIYYDSYRNLVARGILMAPVAPRSPNPFPGFVPDPA